MKVTPRFEMTYNGGFSVHCTLDREDWLPGFQVTLGSFGTEKRTVPALLSGAYAARNGCYLALVPLRRDGEPMMQAQGNRKSITRIEHARCDPGTKLWERAPAEIQNVFTTYLANVETAQENYSNALRDVWSQWTAVFSGNDSLPSAKEKAICIRSE
jgi:hypothetical protein